MVINLTVARRELVSALKMLSKHARKKGAGEAILSYEAGMLAIQISGVVARAEAEGEWPGEARISSKQLSNLWKLAPKCDPVGILVHDDRLQIGEFSIPCVWQEESASKIHLPLDAPLPVILAAALKHSREEIKRSGLAQVVTGAEEKRDELLSRAAKILEPLGISEEELRRFVDEKLI